MKRVYSFYNQKNIIRQQAGNELEKLIFAISWRYQIEIVSKSKMTDIVEDT